MAPAARSSATVRGVAVGHAESEDRSSGVSVVLFEKPTPTVADVRGGASGTFDTASLALEATFGLRGALFLSGGSLFGLDAAAGVRDHVLARGGGVRVFSNPNRLVGVSGAVLFDLPSSERPLPDYRTLGRRAAELAVPGPAGVGRVGAGAGATVGKYLGRASAMAGGIGWAVRPVADRARVGALVAVNAVGAVRDPSSGKWVAGARGAGGRITPPPQQAPAATVGLGTTLAIIVTDLEVPRPLLQRAASMAQAALGSVVVPLATTTDGDAIFVAATGRAGKPGPEVRPGATADALGMAAGAAVVEAALTAVKPSAPAPMRR
jgi:L-aminopeptidase/D-esterase-like protein